MSNPAPPIVFRIPGDWSQPAELIERLPDGYRLTPEKLFLPDGQQVDFIPMPPDRQFAEIFRSSCRRPAAQNELSIVDQYTVNACLSGPGGSLDAARTMMQAGAALVQAGGAGIFIDNCALAHGGSTWQELTDDGSAEALSFAFAAITRGQREISTRGMQTMGFADLMMSSTDVDDDGRPLVEIIQSVCGGTRSISVGDVLSDDRGERFQVTDAPCDDLPTDSPMHNPYGRLKLVNFREIAEGN